MQLSLVVIENLNIWSQNDNDNNKTDEYMQQWKTISEIFPPKSQKRIYNTCMKMIRGV